MAALPMLKASGPARQLEAAQDCKQLEAGSCSVTLMIAISLSPDPPTCGFSLLALRAGHRVVLAR
eukprot:2454409-Alexandrium_andersonii.AAC.1